MYILLRFALHKERFMNIKIKIICALLLSGYLQAESIKKELCPGLEYEQRVITGAQPLVIHLLYADPVKVKIKAQHATGKSLSRESVSSIVERTGAKAGINGGFFRRGGRFNGNALRLLMIHKDDFEDPFYSDPQFWSGALMWGDYKFTDKDNKTYIDRIKLDWKLTIGGKIYPVDRVNQPRGPHEAVIYTKKYNETTLTDKKGIEITTTEVTPAYRKPEGANGHTGVINPYRGVYKKENSNSKIPSILFGGFGLVYSVGPSSSVVLDDIKKDMPVDLTCSIKSYRNLKQLKFKKYIISAMPIILYNGIVQTKEEMLDELTSGKPLTKTSDEIIFNPETEGSWLIEGQHPRTAVGIKPDGTWVMVVVEGRQPTRSIGMSLFELAEFLKSLGCTDAINLGGGGDSAMVIGDMLVNVPSGASTAGAGYQEQQERPVSDAICIYQK